MEEYRKCSICGSMLSSSDPTEKGECDGEQFIMVKCPACGGVTKFVVGGKKKTKAPTDTVVGYNDNMNRIVNILFNNCMRDINLGYGIMIGEGYIITTRKGIDNLNKIKTTNLLASNVDFDVDDLKYVYDDVDYNMVLFHSDSIDKDDKVVFSKDKVRLGQTVYVVSCVKKGEREERRMINSSVGRIDSEKEHVFVLDRIDGAKYMGGLAIDGEGYGIGIISNYNDDSYGGINYVKPTYEIDGFLCEASTNVDNLDISLSIKK